MNKLFLKPAFWLVLFGVISGSWANFLVTVIIVTFIEVSFNGIKLDLILKKLKQYEDIEK